MGGTEPVSTLVALIADVWATALDGETVTPDSDFFTLGGHSITAMRVSVRLGRLLGRSVPVSAIFDFPTPRSLANHLEAA